MNAVPVALNSKLCRSWDFVGDTGVAGTNDCMMTFINPSAGNYIWATFDKLFANNGDKQIIFTLGTTPDYLVTRTAVGSSYRGAKGNMFPDDLTGWSTAVAAVVSRAKNTFGRTGLIWELWNEIDQTATCNDTLTLYGAYAKATYNAIKSVDPTAIVVGPSIAGANAISMPKLVTALTSTDGGSGYGYNYLDGLALHEYVQSTSQISQYDNPLYYVTSYKYFLSYLKNNGITGLPVYITETGVLAADADAGRKYAMRQLTYAALGAKCCLMYSYDTTSYPISGYETIINIATSKLNEGSVISEFIAGVSGLSITIDGVTYTY